MQTKYLTPFPAAVSARLPKGVALLPRKPDFREFKNVPKYWFDNNPYITHAMNVFSVFIPDGERFFIQSINYFEGEVSDPELKKLISAFKQQEAIHFKAHEDFNNTLLGHGIDLDFMLRRARGSFSFLGKFTPKKVQLGITVFFEHLTATGAHLLLAVPAVGEKMDPYMLQFWQWHAVEEIEHKAVAFDIFENIGGGYLLRIFSAVLALLVLAIPFAGAVRPMIKKDGQLGNKEAAKGAMDFIRTENVGATFIKKFFAYFKPGFHPWQLDERDLLLHWIENNPQTDDVLSLSSDQKTTSGAV